MQITLYVAPSIDGYIAKSDKDSEWVSPVCGESFTRTINEYGCIIMGSHTFDQYRGEMYPIKGVLNIVISKDSSRSSTDNDLVFVTSPESAIAVATEHRHVKVLLIGGGTINASFLADDLIDDVIIDIHPLILGQGIKVFENIEKMVSLSRTSIAPMDDNLVQVRYKVNK